VRLRFSEKKQKSEELHDPPRTVTMMANRTAKMRTANENIRTRMLRRKLCFAMESSMDCLTRNEGEERKKFSG